MTDSSQYGSDPMVDRKNALRRRARDARIAQPDKDTLSQRAMERVFALPEYVSATNAMWYVDSGSELRTRAALSVGLASGKRIAVPFCTIDDNGEKYLGVWQLLSLDELVVGKWKIREPPEDRRGDVERRVTAEELDVVVVPGLAFSREGARLGNGQGYYDRLLGNVRSSCTLVGVCYESQLFEGIAVASHDVFMDRVVTESHVYEGLRQRRSNGLT